MVAAVMCLHVGTDDYRSPCPNREKSNGLYCLEANITDREDLRFRIAACQLDEARYIDVWLRGFRDRVASLFINAGNKAWRRLSVFFRRREKSEFISGWYAEMMLIKFRCCLMMMKIKLNWGKTEGLNYEKEKQLCDSINTHWGNSNTLTLL